MTICGLNHLYIPLLKSHEKHAHKQGNAPLLQLMENYDYFPKWNSQATTGRRLTRQTGTVGKLKIMMPSSPCSKCLEWLFQGAQHNPQWTFEMYFRKVYICVNHTREAELYENKLRRLPSCPNVKIDILEWEDYCKLYRIEENDTEAKPQYTQNSTTEKETLHEIVHPLFPKVLNITSDLQIR